MFVIFAIAQLTNGEMRQIFRQILKDDIVLRLIVRGTKDFWEGTFYFDKYENVEDVSLTIELKEHAVIDFDKNVYQGVVLTRDKVHTLIVRKYPYKKLKFQITTLTDYLQPEILNVHFNDKFEAQDILKVRKKMNVKIF